MNGRDFNRQEKWLITASVVVALILLVFGVGLIVDGGAIFKNEPVATSALAAVPPTVSPTPTRMAAAATLSFLIPAPPATAAVPLPTSSITITTAPPPNSSPIPTPSPEWLPLPTIAISPSLFVTPTWPAALISGDLQANYPMSVTTASGAIQVHYQPDTYPATRIKALSAAVDTIWVTVQERLGGQLGRPINVYLSGTLFLANPYLLGFTQSGLFHSFVLVDGAFDPAEVEYLIAHELTHLAATHILGSRSSVMLHEGLAVYIPQDYLVEGAGYLPADVICAAAWQTPAFRPAVQMVTMDYEEEGFAGHIRTFLHYYLGSCFVGYLIETYGLEKFDEVYDGGDYLAVYSKPLSELDAEWQATLADVALPVDPTAFVETVNAVAQAYNAYMDASPWGVHANWEAYLHLNQARQAIYRGQLAQARSELDGFWLIYGK